MLLEMTDFAAARLNMVESQIRPNRVTDPRLVAAFETVAREAFVGEARRGISYIDEDLEVAPGRYLMEPMVLGRLLQAAAPQPGDMALDIGCATGYRSEEHTSELQSLMRISYAVFCLKKKNKYTPTLLYRQYGSKHVATSYYTSFCSTCTR